MPSSNGRECALEVRSEGSTLALGGIRRRTPPRRRFEGCQEAGLMEASRRPLPEVYGR